jgi:hypothetical protein
MLILLSDVTCGGEDYCEDIMKKAHPIFEDLLENATVLQSDCIMSFTSYKDANQKLQTDVLRQNLLILYEDCVSEIIDGFYKSVSNISTTLAEPIEEVADVLLSGEVNSGPLSCVPSQVAAIYPTILSISQSLSAKIDDLTSVKKTGRLGKAQQPENPSSTC